MGYLINTTRPAALTVNGTDYTQGLVSFQVSDASAFRNGIITTTGQIILARLPGQNIEDYQRKDFKRGSDIVFTVTYPSGLTAVHPRGRLQVISSSYQPEQELITLEVGCALIMAKLLDNEDVVLPFEQIPLDETTKTYEGVSASLATATKFLYQDSAGNLEALDYFGGDNYGTFEPGKFTSVRGITALQVQPLAASAGIPDLIELSYQYPSDTKAQNDQGRVDITTTTSNYFFKYPASTFSRINNGFKIADISLNQTTNNNSNITNNSSSGCGSTPPRPINSSSSGSVTGAILVPVACTDQFETVRVPQYVPAQRVETRRTYYNGPAAQTSLNQQEVYGPAVELNSQYFSDKHAYCGSVYASSCNPSPCQLFGTETVLLGKQETKYVFGSANEVVRTIQTTWRPKLSAAQPDDWRSGQDRGVPKDFNYNLDSSGLALYKHQEVIRDFYSQANANIQETTTYTSAVSRGGGIGAALDARSGIKTSEIRRSVSTVTAELRPDSVNAATTNVESASTIIQMYGQVGGYIGSDAGPYTLKEDTPTPILYDDQGLVKSAVNNYGDYLARFIEGDARGLQVAEALTETIGTNWTPNMPFRYYDPMSDKLMSFRADACAWGADLNGCVVVMNGIWVADNQGTVVIPSNLQGDSQPDLDGGAPFPPTNPTIDEPYIDGDDKIVNKRFNFRVDVELTIKGMMKATNGDGRRNVFNSPEDVVVGLTSMIFVNGKITQPGALIALENSGSIPLDYKGNIVVDHTLIVTDDDVLFPPPTP